MTTHYGESNMLKKILLAVATMIATMGFAFAQVDVNKADAAALDSVKGIGPAKSKAIIEERTKGGEFKDWADFEKRVKGIGDKNSAKLSEAGLQVNGKSKDGAPMKAAASAPKASAASASAMASAPAASAKGAASKGASASAAASAPAKK